MKLRDWMTSLTLAFAALIALPAWAGDKPAAEEENGSIPAAEIKVPAPPVGKGQVLFYRKGGFAGSAVACSIHENGLKVSSLGGGKYFIMVTTPGKHEFAVKSEATDKLTIEVEPDETQFVACKIKAGFMVGRPDIRPSNEQEFRAMKKFKMVNEDDMGPGPGALRPGEVKAAVAAGQAPAAAPAPATAPVKSN